MMGDYFDIQFLPLAYTMIQ